MLKIRQIQTADMNCNDAAFASVATFWKRNYEMIFSGMWNFDINLNNNTIFLCDNIKIETFNYFDKYEFYHGIKTKCIKLNDIDDMHRIVIESLKQKNPVYFRFNQFYNPWSDKQNKINKKFEGTLLAVDIKEVDQTGFYVLDIHGSKKLEFLPLENFFKGIIIPEENNYFIFFKINRDENKNFDYKLYLKSVTEELLNNKSGKNSLDQMNKIVRYLNDQDNYLLELKNNNKIINIFKELCRARYLFSNSLRYMGLLNNNESFIEFSDIYLLKMSKWQYFTNLLTKAKFKLDYTKETMNNILKTLKEAVKNEEELTELALQLSDKEKINSSNSMAINKLKYNNISIIEITNYMNDKMFYKKNRKNILQQRKNKNLILIYEEKNLMKNKFKIDGINIEVSIPDNIYDNIICNKQKILIKGKKYKGIIFIQCTSEGIIRDDFEIITSDEQYKKLPFLCSPPYLPCSNFNEQIAWKGNGITFEKGIEAIKTRYIYSKKISFNDELYVSGIILPNNLNIHIFGILLIF